MHHPRHFDPDDHLETETGRIFTAERSAVAWEQSYAELESALRTAPAASRLYVVVGVQGGGKSTWIKANLETLGSNSYFYDAALPRAIHRQRVLSIARTRGVIAVAVWVDTPLDVALARNRLRREDHQVPEIAIRSVFSMMEPPSVDEGFAEVIVVSLNGQTLQSPK